VLASSNGCAEEAFMSARVVRATGTEAIEEARYGDWLRRLYDIGMRQSAAWGLYVVSGTAAHHLAVGLSLLLGGAAVYSGAATPEQLTGFVFYVQLVTSSSLAVCDQYGAIMESIGAGERVLEFLQGAPAPQIAAGTVPQAGFSGRVELRDVGFTCASAFAFVLMCFCVCCVVVGWAWLIALLFCCCCCCCPEFPTRHITRPPHPCIQTLFNHHLLLP
jgi:ATP-binding cassette subfamily B (MDR/TAP) protein 9